MPMKSFLAVISGLFMAITAVLEIMMLKVVSLARDSANAMLPVDERCCIDSGYTNYTQPVNTPRIRMLRWMKNASECVE